MVKVAIENEYNRRLKNCLVGAIAIKTIGLSALLSYAYDNIYLGTMVGLTVLCAVTYKVFKG